MDNYFSKLNSINVNDHVEPKGKLKYLSWTWAWAEVKKNHPDANYRVFENSDGWNYFSDGRTCWVKCSVTINGIEHTEMLPVMDNYNKSIPLERVNSFDVNRSIKRCITKACAMHGLGLYIYSGEDLPEDESPKADALDAVVAQTASAGILLCEDCGNELKGYKRKDGSVCTAQELAEGSQQMFGHIYCRKCAVNHSEK